SLRRWRRRSGGKGGRAEQRAFRVRNARPFHAHAVQRDALALGGEGADARVPRRRPLRLVDQDALGPLRGIVHHQERIASAIAHRSAWESGTLVFHRQATPGIGHDNGALLCYAGDANRKGAGKTAGSAGQDEGQVSELVLDQGGPNELRHAEGGRAGAITAAKEKYRHAEGRHADDVTRNRQREATTSTTHAGYGASAGTRRSSRRTASATTAMPLRGKCASGPTCRRAGAPVCRAAGVWRRGYRVRSSPPI